MDSRFGRQSQHNSRNEYAEVRHVAPDLFGWNFDIGNSACKTGYYISPLFFFLLLSSFFFWPLPPLLWFTPYVLATAGVSLDP